MRAWVRFLGDWVYAFLIGFGHGKSSAGEDAQQREDQP